jgi:hypothetical protein
MEPLDPLGPALRHDGHDYELWLQRDEWHLYRGQPNKTSFRFFLIIKADRRLSPDETGKPGPDKNGDCYCLKKAHEDVNVCAFFANQWVARDKFLKLARGETKSMTYRRQNRNQFQDRRVQLNLPALKDLTLGDVFKALEGRR